MTLGPEADIGGWIKILSLVPASTSSKLEEQKVLLRERLDGYAAVTDSPACGFVPDLMELFPDAIVVWTMRHPASWQRSMAAVANVAAMWFLRIMLLHCPLCDTFPIT